MFDDYNDFYESIGNKINQLFIFKKEKNLTHLFD